MAAENYPSSHRFSFSSLGGDSMKSNSTWLRTVPLWMACATLLAVCAPALQAQEAAASKVVSCNEFLLPKWEMRGKLLGQEECKMIETDFTFLGRKFRRMDMGITGTIDGYNPKVGRYNHYFSANPEFNIAQSGNKNPLF